MFVQVIRGQVSDAAALRAGMDRWAEELGPGASGWLGYTAGVTNDGRFIALVRFESAEAARRNSDRPEQGEWWAETATLFSGEPTFQDSSDVDVDMSGDPDSAGFVQVMRGRTSDPDRVRELMRDDSPEWASLRPDILGNVTVGHDGGGWTMAAYFTSEEEARAGERKEMPPALQAQMEELSALTVGEIEYFDLNQPWLQSHR